mgnify:CR=1 FL=1
MISVEVDLRHLARAIARFPKIAAKGIRLPLLHWQGELAMDFLTSRLNGRSGSMGLNVRTGRTLKGNCVTTPVVTDNNGVVGFTAGVGFLDIHAARIARVHELGTVGKGGSLPDIVPRKGKFLWIPVTNHVRRYDAPLLAWATANGWVAGKPGQARRKRNKRGKLPKISGQQFILLRKASIPPRLGFREIERKHLAMLPETLAAIPGTIAKLINAAMDARGAA